MGRELRRVPANWEHPKDEKGNYIPLLGSSFNKNICEYEFEERMWGLGYRSTWDKGWKFIELEYLNMSYEEWAGPKPQIDDYMPDWPDEERTHVQMYEDTSEGTPISPVMPDIESLSHWLADNKVSAFAGCTATYEQWLSTCKRGWAISGVLIPGQGIMSGVEAGV